MNSALFPRLSRALAHGRKSLLDTLFPIHCVGCGIFGAYLCPDCCARLPRRLRQRCPSCHKATTPRGEVCFACRDGAPRTARFSLDGLFAASYYRDHLLAEVVHTYKYRFIASLSLPLGRWLGGRLTEINLPLPDLYLAVPLHKRRLRYRGFNQSALLVDVLADTLTPSDGVRVLPDCLWRVRATKPQIKTNSREERQANLNDAFRVAPDKIPLVRGQNIWLIDDVATTGATLEECARVLKASGAQSVWGIVLAR